MKTLTEAKEILVKALQARIDLYEKQPSHSWLKDHLRYMFTSTNIPGKYGYEVSKQFLSKVKVVSTFKELTEATQWYQTVAGKNGQDLLLKSFQEITGRHFQPSGLIFANGVDVGSAFLAQKERDGFVTDSLAMLNPPSTNFKQPTPG